MSRRTSSRIANRQKKKQKQSASASTFSAASRICDVFELESVTIWDYLLAEEMHDLSKAFSDTFTREFVDELQLEILDHFAQENKTHLGHNCQCDWMRRLDGILHGENCDESPPFVVNENMPILQTPNGVRALVDALVLTKKLLLPFCAAEDGRGEDMFTPVVCLLTEGGEGLSTKGAVVKAMNRVCKGSGKRFFYNFTFQRGHTRADFIDEHWDEINGSTCEHCIDIPNPRCGYGSLKWQPKAVERIRANCENVYRPLKAAMEKELQFVRFIPKPHQYHPTKFEGLVAGISTSGVFCGLYILRGFWASSRK